MLEVRVEVGDPPPELDRADDAAAFLWRLGLGLDAWQHGWLLRSQRRERASGTRVFGAREPRDEWRHTAGRVAIIFARSVRPRRRERTCRTAAAWRRRSRGGA